MCGRDFHIYIYIYIEFVHNERQQICHYNIYIKCKYTIEGFPLFGTYLTLAGVIA